MKLHTAAAAAALAAATVGASGGLIAVFDLYDHPDGAAAPSAYGLRLDSWTGTSDNPVTFSFLDGMGNSNVQLRVYDDGMGGLELNINGTVWGNSANGGTDYGTFALDLTYTVTAEPNGWEASTVEALGSLTENIDGVGDDDGMAFDLTSILNNQGVSFQFLSDGHRLDGDNSTWVGRGWLSEDGVGGGTNDLLFTAQIIPLPPAAFAGLGMLAGLGVYRRLRRR